jgi:hypothetical protein
MILDTDRPRAAKQLTAIRLGSWDTGAAETVYIRHIDAPSSRLKDLHRRAVTPWSKKNYTDALP